MTTNKKVVFGAAAIGAVSALMIVVIAYSTTSLYREASKHKVIFVVDSIDQQSLDNGQVVYFVHASTGDVFLIDNDNQNKASYLYGQLELGREYTCEVDGSNIIIQCEQSID